MPSRRLYSLSDNCCSGLNLRCVKSYKPWSRINRRPPGFNACIINHTQGRGEGKLRTAIHVRHCDSPLALNLTMKSVEPTRHSGCKLGHCISWAYIASVSQHVVFSPLFQGYEYLEAPLYVPQHAQCKHLFCTFTLEALESGILSAQTPSCRYMQVTCPLQTYFECSSVKCTWKAACSMAGMCGGAKAAKVKISSTASAFPLPAKPT